MKIGRVCRHKEREGLDIVLNRGIYKKRFLVILAFASLMVSCGSDHSKLNELLSSSHCGECAEEHSADTQNPGVSQDPKITAGLVGWRDTVVLKLHDKVPSHIYGAAVNAAESWNKALGFGLRLRDRREKTPRKRRDQSRKETAGRAVQGVADVLGTERKHGRRPAWVAQPTPFQGG